MRNIKTADEITLAQDFDNMKRSIERAGGTFYQYRPCRRNAATIYDIENINHGVVYAQTPLNMNDPFDSMIGFSVEKVYSECISMLVDLVDTDDATKLVISTFIQHRTFGKIAELIATLKDIKGYVNQRRNAMHQTNITFEDFIRKNAEILYNKAPKKFRNSFLNKAFFALMLLIAKLGDLEITEDNISSILKMDMLLEELHQKAVEIRDNLYTNEIKKFLSKITVSCFSVSGWNNQLMWSHYANSYSGICVEYDFSKISEFIGFIYPIKYTDKRPTLSLKDVGIAGFSADTTNNIVKADVDIWNIISAMLCKNTCWKYENEWRIINVGEANTPLFIKIPYIKSITFGMKTDPLCKKLLLEICKDKSIPCFNLIANTENYNLDRVLIDFDSISNNIDEETTFIQLLSKQILQTNQDMTAHMDLVKESIENESFDFDAFSSSLDEILDLLSNIYFLKKSINRVGRIAGDELLTFPVPNGIISTINSVDSMVLTFSTLMQTLKRNIYGLSLSGNIKFQDCVKSNEQIRNICELIEKIDSYNWTAEFIQNTQNKKDIISHYDLLIEEENDPVWDSEELQAYMNKWDGSVFIDAMDLSSDKKVLEIGVGTGRLAMKVAPYCAEFTGIDISSKTIEKARENLAGINNIDLICNDFLDQDFTGIKFDVIYSSLTFMHISNKLMAMKKIAKLLKDDGIFVLSIEKGQAECINYGTRTLSIYPDLPDNIQTYTTATGLNVENIFETEFAYVMIIKKEQNNKTYN